MLIILTLLVLTNYLFLMPPAGLAQTAVAFTEKRRKLRPYAPFANQSNRFTRASELAYAQTTLALML